MHPNGLHNNVRSDSFGKLMVCAVRSVLGDNVATSLDKNDPFGKDYPGRGK